MEVSMKPLVNVSVLGLVAVPPAINAERIDQDRPQAHGQKLVWDPTERRKPFKGLFAATLVAIALIGLTMMLVSGGATSAPQSRPSSAAR